ncbi:purine or other phosphorylase family 1 [Desulfotomaculum nigrificans CO-1-SRB]|uniref:Purine or other phosphorylase family 1 n=1 Tax=Desulfotomaculum nigrificans (strain DSM 14880 / VKM B-2319 / CO-1-SRB) TaxID=868595 RepID=F6B4P7_DESCC|nr:MTAP family purine nucleoside phosphorylase [Desulfotomaculum nigrificans]AEF94159.1 purine or other phosphorylase family 1 [Desulfotomaculum nigrificans CO-1-SRB]
MSQSKIPQAVYAIIGGSSTFSISFPEDLNFPNVTVLEKDLVFTTPFGDSPVFKLFTLGDKKILTLKMHGWRDGVTRADASRQVFWVLREAGVKRILAEGGVGAINHLLKLRDLLIPNDYLDFSMRKDVALGSPYLLTMRHPVCAEMAAELVKAAEKLAVGRVFERGVYAVTDGRHFESPAEINMLGRLGADIVGQSMCPEVYLAREIGACYARIDMVVNYAEGVVKEWEHRELKEIFYSESQRIGEILLTALTNIKSGQCCQCPELRTPTLLKEQK